MKKWLFNPFELVAGWTALFAGMAVIVLTAFIAVAGNIRLDGVIDLHITEDVNLTTALLDGFVNWLCLGFFIYLAGLIFSRSSIRLLDVFGTQALARFPFLFSVLASLLCFNGNILRYLDHMLLHQDGPNPVSIGVADVLLFGCMILVTLLMTVWGIALMYKAYSVSCNVKGTRAALSFTACMVFAEILSKVILSLM